MPPVKPRGWLVAPRLVGYDPYPTEVAFGYGPMGDSRHGVDIIESAYRAAETGQTQELRTTF
jgi:hypothetical protein